MGLDARYIPVAVFAPYFVDKDTGLPLAAGEVKFYSDINRTSEKAVFQISGTPPNYSYTSLGTTLTLSGVGTFQNNSGDQVVPYLYPYDSDGNIELYYITVKSEGEVPQYTLEGVPNLVDTDAGQETLLNYIPNGQFLIHNDLSNDGEIADDSTILAQGGLTFDRSPGSGATDFVTFTRFGSAIDNPTGNPRYALRVHTTIPYPADSYKDVRWKFDDVNKFASEDQYYTLSFSGQTNTGNTAIVTINLIKNYGTGGSPPTTTVVTTVEIKTTETIYNVPFIFGTNEGKTIGTDDDDYLQIAITYPTDAVSDISITDVILTPGNVVVTQFPQTTNAEFLYETLGGAISIPSHTNDDLYLPLVLTPTGIEFSRADIGKIYAAVYSTPNIGELKCDGAAYLTGDYSSDGIPYSRIQSVLWDNTANMPLYGTGTENLSAYIFAAATDNLRISTNQAGSPLADAANGTPSPGFTIATIHDAGNYALNAYMNGSNTVIAIGTAAGAVTAPTAGNSGFTVTEIINQANRKHVFQIQTIAASAMTAGHYFTFATSSGSSPFYMWFKIDGSGSDPAPGGTGIEVDLLSSYTAADVAQVIREALSGFQITSIITAAGSTITPGSYFTINTTAESYYVYYIVSGVGNSPAIGGSTGIPVSILTGDTAAQVATKTQIAINSFWVAMPPFNDGYFLRGIDPNSITDYDSASRFSLISNLYGDNLGTFEIDQIISHNHGSVLSNINENTSAQSPGPEAFHNNGVSGSTGGTETRPVNAYVNFVIKY